MSFANWIGVIFTLLVVAGLAIVSIVSPTVRLVLRRALAQPSFLIVFVVLMVAALGLNFSVSSMQLHFKKEPVELVKPLGALPEKFGSWVQVSQDQPLDKELQDVLGTDQYIFRDYVDEQVVGVGIGDKFRDRPVEERREELARIRKQFPQAVISLSVTYYTGMVDTVAHVPDRCVTADGYEPKTYETPKWPIARDLPAAMKQANGGEDVEVRFINFEDQTGTTNFNRAVSYFFHTNGKFISSPLGVRNELANLFVKKGYYAKIETMMAVDPKVSTVAAQDLATATSDFLTAALPEVHKCMPDWEKATGGQTAAGEQVAAK